VDHFVAPSSVVSAGCGVAGVVVVAGWDDVVVAGCSERRGSGVERRSLGTSLFETWVF